MNGHKKNHSSLILDIDSSVTVLEDSLVWNFSHLQENLRYCSLVNDSAWKELHDFLLTWWKSRANILTTPPIHFLGHGDFHHLSYCLIDTLCKVRKQAPLSLLVLDNHPDNMFLPWGIHCASWVSWAAKHPEIKKIVVVGIHSQDLSGFNLLQNRFSYLRSGKVEYFTSRITHPIHRLLSSGHVHSYSSLSAETIVKISSLLSGPTYLSIDKDVFHQSFLSTPWDQGMMEEHELWPLLERIREQVVAVDVCGDWSSYQFHKRWKRHFRALDGGEGHTIPSMLSAIREKHTLFHQQLIKFFSHSSCSSHLS